MKRLSLTLLAVAIILSGCCSTQTADHITQTSTIDALLAGMYDGDMTCGELLENGDFGIGTFDTLDGEMIVHKGKLYQIKADGHVHRPAMSTKTPFASVCQFNPEIQFQIQTANFKAVNAIIDEKIPNQNLFVAIEITGTFKYVKTRSVPAQKKPYPPLSEVAKTQPIFKRQNVVGTIVGFRCPAFVKGINVPGYHFHFLSDDKNFGGHILEFQLDSGLCKADICNKYTLVLPQSDILKDLDLSQDKSEELEKVEMGN